MNTQNILKFFGSKLDLKLDSSEFYDFEIGKTDTDFNSEVIDFTTEIQYSTLVVDSNCITGTTLDIIKPWEIEINEPYNTYSCDFTVRRRTEKGWTLDFVFNKDNLDWSNGSTFYYWGIKDEIEQTYFADNNLSFSFTSDGRIKWEKYHYSGVCDSNLGYVESYYISSGQTPVLCTKGTSNDFNITIVFDRYKRYTECDLENEGGWNDLIRNPYPVSSTGNTNSTTTQIMTGYTITDDYTDYITGATGTTQYIEQLNQKWFDERHKRLGTLRIYLNGVRIYKIKDWEEVIPSKRQSENPIVQIWGGGTTGYVNIHTGDTDFVLHQVKYFEDPLDFVNVKHHYITSIKPNFSIIECGESCEDDVGVFTDGALLTENSEVLITEDLNILTF